MGAIPSCATTNTFLATDPLTRRTLWGWRCPEQVGLTASEFNSSVKGRTIGLYE